MFTVRFILEARAEIIKKNLLLYGRIEAKKIASENS
jgi:hypothetical protein